jgi:DNA-binding winged helix-turn-helix (wHTH) protein
VDFLSAEVQECALLFQRSSFGEAQRAVERLLAGDISPLCRVEGLSLALRIQIERDEVSELESLRAQAIELVPTARTLQSAGALYHFGIVALLCEDPDTADDAFRSCLELSRDDEQRALARYGIAAVLHNRKESEAAHVQLEQLEEEPLAADTRCLVALLKGNALRALGKLEAAHAAYLQAQGELTTVKAFYMKNWVFFGLAVIHSRRGDTTAARTLFNAVLSITHPREFRRLYKLAADELTRLETQAEVLFDPITGDIVSNRGYLCLRRKPTLIAILSAMIGTWPEAVSKESLYQQVWSGEYHPLRHDGLIYSHIQRLRHILLSDMQLGDFIQTVCDGYRLNPKIQVKFRDEGGVPTPRTPTQEVKYAQ